MGNDQVLKCFRVSDTSFGQQPSPGQGPSVLTDIQDPSAGPLHRLDYSDDINHILKWPTGLLLADLPLQTKSIISEAK